MSDRKVYHVNLNGQGQMRPNWKADAAVEFEDAYAYCLDSPSLLPAGSTMYMFADDKMLATITSISHRERA